VILEHRDLIQKLGVNDIHHNTGSLTTNKNNFFAGEKEIQCYQQKGPFPDYFFLSALLPAPDN
jgi:hypothetical protein